MLDQDRADIGIWRLAGNKPQRYMPAELSYEKHLEAWIERDPTLISPDMHLIGRQVALETGFLDILGIDSLGRLAAIELKKTDVRRETVAQALDYAGCLADMPSPQLKALVVKYLEKRGLTLNDLLKQLALDETVFEQPEILIYVVGTSRDINLTRVLKNTAFMGNQINLVTFDVYKNSDGEHILLRQLSEVDNTSPRRAAPASPKRGTSGELPTNKDSRVERLMKLAESNGVGAEFRKVYEVATALGLYPKVYKWSIMYAPPQNKNRVLFCAWATQKQGLFDIYVNSDAFAEFYPISQRKARQIMGEPRRTYLTPDQTKQFIATVQNLFTEITRNA